MATRLEYIWVGGSKELRSKVKVTKNLKYIKDVLNKKHGEFTISDIPMWDFDGSSTGQATGDNSEVLLKPCKIYKNTSEVDGFEGSYYVLCETLLPNMTAHSTNTRSIAAELFKTHGADYEPMFGIEHEFFLLDGKTNKPLGFPIIGNPKPQGQYYCSVGEGNAYGKKFLNEALSFAVKTGIQVTGSNLEVCPGQMEIQVCNYGIDAADDSMMLKYLLSKLGEDYGYIIEWGAKPVSGDWNGSGCHVNFSTNQMREEGGLEHIMDAINKLRKKHLEHINVYGDDNCERLTGLHETSDINTFSCGIADRGCSIRIPRNTERDKKGYFEDRRPSSSADMYLVTAKLFKTCIDI